jgi:Cobalamin adenosyltransferase
LLAEGGDKGPSGLMGNRRVCKHHSRVEAHGALDKVNTALSMARASADDAFVHNNPLASRKIPVVFWGALATAVEECRSFQFHPRAGSPTVAAC